MDEADSHGAVLSAHARVITLQNDADRLCEELQRVTARLSARTARSVRLSIAHVANADQLAGHCLSSMQQLQRSSSAFLEDMAQLRASLDDIASIARMTQEVRAELVRLEASVNRLGTPASSQHRA